MNTNKLHPIITLIFAFLSIKGKAQSSSIGQGIRQLIKGKIESAATVDPLKNVEYKSSLANTTFVKKPSYRGKDSADTSIPIPTLKSKVKSV